MITNSHGRGHRFNPCAAHQQNQRLSAERRVPPTRNKAVTQREQTWVGCGFLGEVGELFGMLRPVSGPAATATLTPIDSSSDQLHQKFAGRA